MWHSLAGKLKRKWPAKWWTKIGLDPPAEPADDVAPNTCQPAATSRCRHRVLSTNDEGLINQDDLADLENKNDLTPEV